MWFGLFSDIHANREALEACLGHARDNGITRFIFLGDYVGYGADPGFAVDTVRREVENGAVCVTRQPRRRYRIGHWRHERGRGAAIDWTRSQLTAAQSDFLTRLPLTFNDNDRLFVHASAHDPAGWAYITSAEDASTCFAADACASDVLRSRACATALPLSPGRQITGIIPAPTIEIPLHVKERWIAVIGSVGQPRDGNPEACYGAH